MKKAVRSQYYIPNSRPILYKANESWTDFAESADLPLDDPLKIVVVKSKNLDDLKTLAFNQGLTVLLGVHPFCPKDAMLHLVCSHVHM